jgi:DNA-directed RNA polymerase specialized sigma24 family protein
MRRDLIERAMAGDHDAFSELARAAIARLYAAAQLILRDPVASEDAIQETLVAAWRDLSALRDPDRFDAWLHRLLVRACYREARRGRRAGRSRRSISAPT